MALPVDSTRPAATSTRTHEVDALRSSMMLLGVVLHAAAPFAASVRWLVQSGDRHPAFDVLFQVIHLFRMPAFFVVSGYFSALVLQRRGTAEFLRDRTVRLAFPFVAALLTVNLLQVVFLAREGGLDGARVLDALAAAWGSGQWVGHLWFLVDVLLYCALLAAAAPVLASLASRHLRVGAELSIARTVTLAIAGGFAAPALSSLAGGRLDGYVLGLVQPVELLHYLPFFAVGALLYGEASALARFSRVGWGTFLLAAAALALALASQGRGGIGLRVVFHLSALVLYWSTVRMVFAFFHRFASRPSAAFAYLADASYSVYLLHHVVVVVAASVLVGAGGPAPGSFLVILLLASAIPLAVHHFVIRPSPALSLAFNGRRKARPRPARVQ